MCLLAFFAFFMVLWLYRRTRLHFFLQKNVRFGPEDNPIPADKNGAPLNVSDGYGSSAGDLEGGYNDGSDFSQRVAPLSTYCSDLSLR